MMLQVQLELGSTSLQHGYEYLGVPDSHALTPQTDRCFAALLRAVHARSAGALLGPAGVGKSETVRALAAAAGMRCAAVNAASDMDHRALSRLVAGAAASGAWCAYAALHPTALRRRRLHQRMRIG